MITKIQSCHARAHTQERLILPFPITPHFFKKGQNMDRLLDHNKPDPFVRFQSRLQVWNMAQQQRSVLPFKRELQRTSFSCAQLHCGSLPRANHYNEWKNSAVEETAKQANSASCCTESQRLIMMCRYDQDQNYNWSLCTRWNCGTSRSQRLHIAQQITIIIENWNIKLSIMSLCVLYKGYGC